jgi:inner membrane transporter RhtA
MTSQSQNRRRLTGAALVLVSCSAVEGSAAIASTLFDDMHPAVVAAWRQTFGALTLLVVLRPRLVNRPPREWARIAALGLAIAAMNIAFYQAVELAPLGIAATLLYLGAFAVAAVQTPRSWMLLVPTSALAGVALVSRPTGSATLPGIAFGLGAAGALAAYTVLAQRLGQDGGLDRLALAVGTSAVVLSPIAVWNAKTVPSADWPILGLSGAVGVGLAFACDFVALKLAGTRIVATFFAFDPVIGATIGALALSQALPLASVAGIVIVASAGAVTAASNVDDQQVGRRRSLDLQSTDR